MESYSLWIPVRNEENTIGTVIHSALAQENPPERIYVCVNGSSDGTQAIVTDVAHEFHQVIPLTSEPWKANAWNSIIRRAQEDDTIRDSMVFCDGDIRFWSPQTLSSLVQLTSESTCMMLGASVIQLPSARTTPYKLKSPSGQLYALKTGLLNRLRQDYNWEMPPDTINEDLFLVLLAFPEVDVTDKVFFYCAKPHFLDLLITQRRILKWIRQLIERGKGPNIHQLLERMSHSGQKSHWLWKLKYALIPFLARLESISPGDHIWKVATSTKKLV